MDPVGMSLSRAITAIGKDNKFQRLYYFADTGNAADINDVATKYENVNLLVEAEIVP
jgi:hypothetical protein